MWGRPLPVFHSALVRLTRQICVFESCDYNSMLFTSWTAMLMTERWGLPNEIKRKIAHIVTVLEFLVTIKHLHLSNSFSVCPHSPPSLRDRLDLFYVQLDPAYDPDGQLWFTTTPLERQTLENLLTQVLLVRDVYTDKHYTEEDMESVDGVEAVEGE